MATKTAWKKLRIVSKTVKMGNVDDQMKKALIDAKVLLEVLGERRGDTSSNNRCLDLIRGELRDSERRYELAFSSVALGELRLALYERRKAADQDETLLQLTQKIDRFLGRITLLGLSREAIHLSAEILRGDPELKPLDALQIATAILEECAAFVFLDRRFRVTDWLRGFARSKGLDLVRVQSLRVPVGEFEGK